MPHSSGGGSSHGGSHGGSHSSHSHGGSSSNPKFGNSYYPGSHRYVYYVNRHPRYYFSDEPYTLQTAEAEKKKNIFLGGAFIFFGFIALIFVILTNIHFPRKVTIDYSPEIVIKDDIDVLTDTEEIQMREAFTNFLDQTGIAPSFISVPYKEWHESTDTLELYAYRRYVDMFPDEKHWLAVYTSDGRRDSWGWEGMIGDDCESMITYSLEDQFTKEVQENLWASSRYSVAGAIIAAYTDIAEKAQHISFNSDAFDIVPAFFGTFIFLFLGILVLVKGIKMDPEADPRINSTQCKTAKEKPQEIKCEYCGGIYVPGTKYTCPHCGAAATQQTD